jgi:ferric-dicitrate binding protein FerR (iron transport regulator)
LQTFKAKPYMTDQQIAHLLELYFNGSITPAQKEVLASWIQDHEGTEQFEKLMEQSWQQFRPEQAVTALTAGHWLDTIMAKAKEAEQAPVMDMPAKRPSWKWYVAAAAVILFMATGIAFWLFPGHKSLPDTAALVKNDVAPPAGSKAILTLANGRQITLDSVAEGALARQGSIDIVKLGDGKITYKGAVSGNELQYNTLTVPAGSSITSITLSDGTTVVLNAASSITYPVAFNGPERKVAITGEVWFEVAKNARKPFIVHFSSPAGGGREGSIEVLGTKFNVNAYADEAMLKVTLVEGSLKVTAAESMAAAQNKKNQTILKPGEQARVEGEQLSVQNNVDIEQVIAWKNGMFLYKGTDIKTIMRELARVYKVGVKYESVSNEMFYAETPRNTNISNMFKMLELTGEVHFRIEGDQVTVLK